MSCLFSLMLDRVSREILNVILFYLSVIGYTWLKRLANRKSVVDDDSIEV